MTQKERYQQAKERGRCYRCQNPAMPGSSTPICAGCREKARADSRKSQARRRECGVTQAQRRKLVEAKAARGECLDCAAPAEPGRKRCDKHLTRARNYGRSELYQRIVMTQFGRGGYGGAITHEQMRTIVAALRWFANTFQTTSVDFEIHPEQARQQFPELFAEVRPLERKEVSELADQLTDLERLAPWATWLTPSAETER